MNNASAINPSKPKHVGRPLRNQGNLKLRLQKQRRQLRSLVLRQKRNGTIHRRPNRKRRKRNPARKKDLGKRGKLQNQTRLEKKRRRQDHKKRRPRAWEKSARRQKTGPRRPVQPLRQRLRLHRSQTVRQPFHRVGKLRLSSKNPASRRTRASSLRPRRHRVESVSGRGVGRSAIVT